MTTKRRITVDESKEDSEFVARFHERTETLARMVLEAVRDNPQWLLSPVMRKTLVEKAQEVLRMSGPLKHKLHADNPCEDLKPWEAE